MLSRAAALQGCLQVLDLKLKKLSASFVFLLGGGHR